MHIQFEIFYSIEKFILIYIHRSCVIRFLIYIKWSANKFVRKRFFIKKWYFLYETSWRICSKGPNRFQKKKKKKKSDFPFRIFTVPIQFWTSRILNLIFDIWVVMRRFRLLFSKIFDFFDFHSFYSTFKLYNISNEGGKRGWFKHFNFSNCNAIMWKCWNVLIIKYERFIEARKVCRDLIHFISRCSIANFLINQVFHLLSTD